MRFLPALALSLVVCSLGASLAQAFDAKMITYSIEPIVGYELQRKSEPEPHAKLTFVYGARAVAGFHLLSAEAEYTRGSSDEEYPASSLRIEQLTQNYRLGRGNACHAPSSQRRRNRTRLRHAPHDVRRALD